MNRCHLRLVYFEISQVSYHKIEAQRFIISIDVCRRVPRGDDPPPTGEHQLANGYKPLQRYKQYLNQPKKSAKKFADGGKVVK